ncbi:MAG TPA: choloylglycine hydrolase family protein [Edaphobacter sp.]
MCTEFLLLDKDNSVVIGRSMEFGENLGSQILVGGRGTKKHSAAPDSPMGGLSWTAKYGYVGLNVAGLGLEHLICDGMNEKGLSIGALWLPGYTQYIPTVSSKAKALDVTGFTNWVLGNFATVAEVKAGLTDVQIWGGSLANNHIPLHFSIHDASGKSAVLEFLKGNTQGLWQDNPVGVLTNAPPFEWQLSNIGNYAGLSAVDALPITIGGTAFPPPGHGSGMRGIPGDSTPPSRFIRILFQKQFATQPANSTDASNLALHLLNTVDIPLGTSAAQQEKKPSKGNDDYTQWVVIKALTAKTFSYRTADNPTVMQINFDELDLDDAAEVAYSMPQEATYIDVTEQLSPAKAASR